MSQVRASHVSPIALASGGALALLVAMGLGRFAYTPILPAMMAGLGLSASDAGLIASANYLGYLVGAVLASGGWGRGHERAILLVSLTATAALSAAMAATESLALFLAIRFAAGLGSACSFVFVAAIAFPRLGAMGRPELGSFLFGGVGLGIALSAVMCGILVIQGSGWEANWLWAGILGLIAIPVVAWLIEPAPARAGRPQPEPALALSAPLLRIIVAYGFFGFGFVVTSTFLIAIMRAGNYGYFAETAVWACTGLSAFLSIWAWNGLARQIGLGSAFAAGCLLQSIGIAASVLVPGLAGVLLSGVLIGGTFVGITAVALRAAARLAPNAPRRTLAWMTVAYGVGQIVGPFMAGHLADRSGNFLLASLIAAGFLLAAALVVPRR